LAKKKNTKRDPNLRAVTVARVAELVKQGLAKSQAFDRIAAETGRARDAVQMLYYRAMRNPKSMGLDKAPQIDAPKTGTVRRRRRRRTTPAAAARPLGAVRTAAGAAAGELPRLLTGIATSINALLTHLEKTVKENSNLRDQAKRFEAISNLVRGR
jgi:hypothetical protein